MCPYFRITNMHEFKDTESMVCKWCKASFVLEEVDCTECDSVIVYAKTEDNQIFELEHNDANCSHLDNNCLCSIFG